MERFLIFMGLVFIGLIVAAVILYFIDTEKYHFRISFKNKVLKSTYPHSYANWRFELAARVDAYINAMYEDDGEEASSEMYRQLKDHILKTPFVDEGYFEGVVRQAIAVLNKNIVPDGSGDTDALNTLYGIFDNAEIVTKLAGHSTITLPVVVPQSPNLIFGEIDASKPIDLSGVPGIPPAHGNIVFGGASNEVIVDRRDLFDYIRTAFIDGNEYGNGLSKHELHYKATGYSEKQIKGWTTLRSVNVEAQVDAQREALK